MASVCKCVQRRDGPQSKTHRPLSWNVRCGVSQTLVELRKKIRIIENHLREKDYSFDYAKQPSKAMFKYRKAFLRNDGERYNAFLEAVSSGEKQLHADNLAPYEIVRSALNANRWGFHADLTVGEKAASMRPGRHFPTSATTEMRWQ